MNPLIREFRGVRDFLNGIKSLEKDLDKGQFYPTRDVHLTLNHPFSIGGKEVKLPLLAHALDMFWKELDKVTQDEINAFCAFIEQHFITMNRCWFRVALKQVPVATKDIETQDEINTSEESKDIKSEDVVSTAVNKAEPTKKKVESSPKKPTTKRGRKPAAKKD